MCADFEITIAATEPPVTNANVTVRYSGGVRVGVLQLDDITAAVDQLKAALQEAEPDPAVLQESGRCLFEALFSGQILDAFRESMALVHTQQGCLRLRLYAELPAVIAVPWEYLFDPGQMGWLALHPHISLVRALPLAAGAPLPVGGLLRVLVMLASPTDLTPLDSIAEWDHLQNATVAAPVELVRSEPTYPALLAALRQSPQVFHFVGHGVFDDTSQQGSLVFVGENGEAELIPAEKLAILLGGCKTLRLVILNTCASATTGTHSAFSGVAQCLIQHQIPAVVAMQTAITDTDALHFTEELYQALTDGLGLEQAMGEGRKRLNEVSCHWGVPTLYFQGTEPFVFPVLNNEVKAARLWQKVAQIDDPERRRKTLTVILTLQPEHAAARKALKRLDDETLAARLYTDAEANYQQQQWREAYRALEQVEHLVPNLRNTRSLLAEVLGKLGTGSTPTVAHPGQIPQYELILNALKEGRLVPFLGWEVSRFGRPAQDSWVQGRYLPNADELAHILVEPLHGEVEGVLSLLQASQYVSLLEGESALYERLYALYAGDYPPTMLHHLLAELPGHLQAKGYPLNQERRFVIFSTAFDDLLERAFVEVGQPYHLFAYRHQAADANGAVHPGRFVHIPPAGEPIELISPATYIGHDSDRHPILVKLCGQGVTLEPENSVTITEDQYLDYLPMHEIGALLPLTLLKQIKRRSFLFFGYSLQPWHFRLLWQCLKFQKSALHEKAWAIVPSLTVIEQAFWRSQGVEPLIGSPENVVAYVNHWLGTL